MVTAHAVEAVVEQREVRDAGASIGRSIPVITIIGGSISPPAVPSVNDELTIAGATYKLLRLVRADPAGAVYEFEVT